MSRALIAACALLTLAFGFLCYSAHENLYLSGDVEGSLWVQGLALPYLTSIMQAVSYVSSMIPAVIIVTLFVIGLLATRKQCEAAFVAASTTFAILFNWLLKLIINRPRPDSELVQVLVESNGFSFPSGHTVYAVIFYGFLAYLVSTLIRKHVVKVVSQCFLVLLILLTGLSRIYLGAHWASDVIGSYLLGGLVLLGCIALYRNYKRRGVLVFGFANLDSKGKAKRIEDA